MELKEALKEELIIIDSPAKNKASLLKEMVHAFYEAGNLADPEQFLSDVYAREAEGVTGIGNHIAIPHGKSTSVRQVGVCIATLENEIAWESLDDTGAKVVVLFAVGADTAGATDHLKLLAQFSRKLAKESVVAGLCQARSIAEVEALLLN